MFQPLNYKKAFPAKLNDLILGGRHLAGKDYR